MLEARGINCWIAPRNVPPGAKYGETIVHAIEDASAMILIFSAHSNSSEQVMNEVERAVSKKKRIFPLKINDINPSTELEYFISRRHWLDASTESLEACTEQLAAAIRQPEEISTQTVQQQAPDKLPATRKKTIIFGIGIILALFVLLAVLFPDQIWRKPAGDDNAIHQQKDLAGTDTDEGGLVEKKGKTEEPLKPYQQTILLKPDEPTILLGPHFLS